MYLYLQKRFLNTIAMINDKGMTMDLSLLADVSTVIERLKSKYDPIEIILTETTITIRTEEEFSTIELASPAGCKYLYFYLTSMADELLSEIEYGMSRNWYDDAYEVGEFLEGTADEETADRIIDGILRIC